MGVEHGNAAKGGKPSPRVLLVEDEALVALTLKAQLESLGCQVVGSAQDADSAAEMARALQPDLAVVDLGLAGSSGTDAIRAITSETAARVIVVTAYGPARAREAREAGASMALTKPVLVGQLAHAIAQVWPGRDSGARGGKTG